MCFGSVGPVHTGREGRLGPARGLGGTALVVAMFLLLWAQLEFEEASQGLELEVSLDGWTDHVVYWLKYGVVLGLLLFGGGLWFEHDRWEGVGLWGVGVLLIVWWQVRLRRGG